MNLAPAKETVAEAGWPSVARWLCCPPGPPASPQAWDAVAAAQQQLSAEAAARTAAVQPQLAKVLAAFQAERVGSHHFASVSGYGHNDLGRDTLDRVFARVLGAEAAAVRLQFVSGTHAITAALFGVLRPGDRLLSITGRPYDTLEEVIGLRGKGQGSLAEFGVSYVRNRSSSRYGVGG